ncbi:MAG: enoyl-CoA hydratase/isomerase family protein [Proteobacteria bacterium]|jgi:enoyl-CoA hydratase|nr:enoyl-CoA hydratase/isomerase family protein [Pseudomonadota bacterium]
MRSDFTTITPERVEEHILVLHLDRPERANAMNTQMGIELRAFFQDMYVDQEGVRVVIVTGRGTKAFSAGGDLKDRDGMTDQQWQHQHAIYEQMVRGLRDCPVPVICAVNGAAYGGGCEFALGCDFIYAASTARFALTEVTLGIMPGAAGTINLPHAVGERRAREIIYTGTPFTAAEGQAWGLVNKVCEPEALLEETLATARRIAGNGPISIRQAKKSIALATQIDRNSAYMFELEAYNRMVPTADRLEGVRAFNEKRKPRFEGR